MRVAGRGRRRESQADIQMAKWRGQLRAQYHDPWYHDLSWNHEVGRLTNWTTQVPQGFCGVFFNFKILLFIWESEREHDQGEGQRKKEKENLKQTPHWVQGRGEGAWSHNNEIMTLVETKSLTLNRLSHPGASAIKEF